jgi:hypothetical protein
MHFVQGTNIRSHAVYTFGVDFAKSNAHKNEI